MSQYSYNYSEGDQPADFLDNSNPFSFDLADHPPKPPTEVQATHYTEFESEAPPSVRCRRVIEVCYEGKQAYVRARRGRGDETMLLQANFKTLLGHHLRELIYLKLLGEKQRLNSLAYLRASSSFASLQALLHPTHETKDLRASLVSFIGNPSAIKQLICGHANFNQKLLMLKFIERFREILQEDTINKKWKSL